MDIIEIRRANLRRLASKSKNHSAFARKIGVSRSYLGQIIGANPRKGIGNAKAREIEATLKLPPGWMDAGHTVEGLDTDAFISAVEMAEDIMRREQIRLDPKKRARLYLRVYNRIQSANVDPQDIRELVLLAS